MAEPRAWLIRAGRSGERDSWALKNFVSGGGFHEVPDLTGCSTREQVAGSMAATFVGAKEQRINNFANQLWALRGRIEKGDLVVLPLKSSPGKIAIGRVTGDYEYRDDPEPSRRHVRPVEWVRDDVPRSAVKQDLLYSLGAFLTICEVKRNDAAWRIAKLVETGLDPGARPGKGGASATPASTRMGDPEATDVDSEQIDVEQYSLDRLQSYVIETFAGHKMQNLVAALLEAEGFHCQTAPEGPDGGIDVLAGTGPLGLDQPRLVVQVKSEASAVGAPVVQQLLGAMNTHSASQGLLVAWGGVTKPAQQLLGNQYFRVRVWTADDLLTAVFRNYDRLSEELRADLPLKQVWTLVEEVG